MVASPASEATGRVNVNARPFARLAADIDLAAVGGDDLADDRQAQPRPAGMPRGRDAVELLENSGQLLGRDSLAGVSDGEPCAVAVGMRRDVGSSRPCPCAGSR